MFQKLKNWLGLQRYVSDLDQRLIAFRKTHLPSQAVRREKEKSARIASLRDKK